MKLLVANEKPFAREALDAIAAAAEQRGVDCSILIYKDRADLEKAVADADALIVRSDIVDAALLDKAPNLKVIVRAGAGYDNIDLAAAKERGIVVENTPGQNSNAVAELVFGMLIMAARNMYDGKTGSELKGKRLGIHAFGQVGRNVARIARGLDMQVSALDPFCPDSVMTDAGVTPLHDVETLYRDNEVVSLHIPSTPRTRRSVNHDLIASMPQGAILVNTARKDVIDEDGLEKALAERPDLKYVADIRPDNADVLLQRFPGRVFFTPKKMGAQTAEANLNAALAAANQCCDLLVDGTVRFQVNK